MLELKTTKCKNELLNFQVTACILCNRRVYFPGCKFYKLSPFVLRIIDSLLVRQKFYYTFVSRTFSNILQTERFAVIVRLGYS